MLKLTKKIISRRLVPHLSKGEYGPECRVGLWQIVRSVVHRIKTGKHGDDRLSVARVAHAGLVWQTHNYVEHSLLSPQQVVQRWLVAAHVGVAAGNQRPSWICPACRLMAGSHTPAWRGGEAVAYQGRKKHKTTNMLFLTDSQGIPLACSEPVAGNHSDLFDYQKYESFAKC